ncbi:MAG TPA: VWA domain-containing protein [Thermoanaerobaculia bacterium]|nr:VWA domain-containing protein [Thermoanaerobaculia bacterium]
MKKTVWFALAAFASAAVAQQSPPAAQPQAPVFKESVEVHVMDLDVAVTDSQGRPVSDLTRNDFTIRVGGRPVPIDYFARVDQGTIHAPDLSSASPDRVLDVYKSGGEAYVPRHFLIYVDSSDLSPGYRNRSLDFLKDFVTRLGPTDTARVVLFDRRPKDLTEWTSSKETLIDALETMEKSVGMSRLTNQMQTISQIDSTRSRSSRMFLAQNYAEQESVELDNMIKDMRAQLSTMTPLPGKKAFLFVSGSLPQQPGFAMIYYAGGAGRGFAATTPFDSRQIALQIDNLAKAANADEVTFYTVDGWGLTAEGASAANMEPLANRPGLGFFTRQNAQSGLLSLAQDTGGIALVNTNDLKKGLGQIYQDASTYYSVGVNLSSLPSAAYQNVEVTVDRPGLNVRYRRGYAVKSSDDRARDIARAALKTNVSYQSFPVKLQVGASAKAKKQYDQPITVVLPASALTFLPESGAPKANAEIYVGVVDDDGRVSDIAKEEASFNEPPAGSPDAVLAYPITLQMRKGNARIVVNVRDKATGKMGTARTDVHIE